MLGWLSIYILIYIFSQSIMHSLIHSIPAPYRRGVPGSETEFIQHLPRTRPRLHDTAKPCIYIFLCFKISIQKHICKLHARLMEYIYFIYTFLIKQTCIHIFLCLKLNYLIKHISNFMPGWLNIYFYKYFYSTNHAYSHFLML